MSNKDKYDLAVLDTFSPEQQVVLDEIVKRERKKSLEVFRQRISILLSLPIPLLIGYTSFMHITHFISESGIDMVIWGSIVKEILSTCLLGGLLTVFLAFFTYSGVNNSLGGSK